MPLKRDRRLDGRQQPVAWCPKRNQHQLMCGEGEDQTLERRVRFLRLGCFPCLVSTMQRPFDRRPKGRTGRSKPCLAEMRESAAGADFLAAIKLPKHEIRTEADRYIAWPM